MLEEKVLAPYPGLGKSDQPVLAPGDRREQLRGGGRREVLRHPGHQILRQERLVVEARVVGGIRVPRIYGERGLDDRQVALVLRIEAAQGLETIAVSSPKLRFDRENVEEIVGYARGRVSRL